MLIDGTKTLPAPRAAVWAALNDPAFLQASIPGCERIESVDADKLSMTLTAAVGPIKARFTTELQRSDVVEGVGYTLKGEGSAGAAGSARGEVRVRLSDIDGGTQLDYSAQTDISGRIAQLGSRLIDSTARRFSEQFFANVARQMSATRAAAPAASAAGPRAIAANAAPPAAVAPGSLDGLVWKVAVGCAIGSGLGTLVATLLLRGAGA